jgi:hypothetical protein
VVGDAGWRDNTTRPESTGTTGWDIRECRMGSAGKVRRSIGGQHNRMFIGGAGVAAFGSGGRCWDRKTQVMAHATRMVLVPIARGIHYLTIGRI